MHTIKYIFKLAHSFSREGQRRVAVHDFFGMATTQNVYFYCNRVWPTKIRALDLPAYFKFKHCWQNFRDLSTVILFLLAHMFLIWHSYSLFKIHLLES